ncbi:uncharacterized protein LOC120090760 [Benincasa hispida]|uniref:uncharacterized protein LOC120090760 n=1 Tax=Benincasa hispida TaxID=102211 RepID=UPI0019011E33|nr:uncharacterized protein LOC120090760 [Benincasa hispida]
MIDAETIEEFFNRVLLIVNQSRSTGEAIEDKRVVENILRSMTRRYEHIVVAIEESKHLPTLSINSLMGYLQSHRAKTIKLLQIEEQGQVQVEEEAEVEVVKIFLTYNVSIVEVMGIFQANYWSKKSNSNQAKTTLMYEQEDNDQGLLFLTFNVQEKNTEDIWYLDSGCTKKIAKIKDIFIFLDESHQNEVKSGDNKMLEVKGKGDILVKTNNGAKRITDIYYGSGLKQNLLSVRQLLLKGYDVIFKDSICEIKTENGGLITKVCMTDNKMFPIKMYYEKLVCFETLVKDTQWLWHCQYGYLSFDTLSHMYQQRMVRGMPDIKKENQLCEAYTFRKHHQNLFPTRGSWRA